jgi:tetratricopeptide (TPR) repeat protein
VATLVDQALALREQLARDFPDVPQHRLDLAETLTSLGDRSARSSKTQDAQTAYSRAVKLCQELADKYPTVALYRESLVLAQHELIKLLESTGQLSDQQAEQDYRQEIEDVSKLTNEFPASSIFPLHLALCYRDLAMRLANHDHPDEAIAAHREATQRLEALAKDRPGDGYHRSLLAKAHLDFGQRLPSRGRQADGEAFCRQALDSFEKLVAEFPQHVAYARDLEDCRRRMPEAVGDATPPSDTSSAPPTK